MKPIRSEIIGAAAVLTLTAIILIATFYGSHEHGFVTELGTENTMLRMENVALRSQLWKATNSITK